MKTPLIVGIAKGTLDKKKRENNDVTISGGVDLPRDFPHQSNSTVLNFQPLERVPRKSPHTQFGRRRALLNNTNLLTENRTLNEDMDLDSMKYAELRSLAKELGLKANMKVGFLR